jgi:hypothetical protein
MLEPTKSRTLASAATDVPTEGVAAESSRERAAKPDEVAEADVPTDDAAAKETNVPTDDVSAEGSIVAKGAVGDVEQGNETSLGAAAPIAAADAVIVLEQGNETSL